MKTQSTGKSRKKNLIKTMSFRPSMELHYEIEARSKKENKYPSQWIRQFLEEKLLKKNKK